jgi:hypothetical protein
MLSSYFFLVDLIDLFPLFVKRPFQAGVSHGANTLQPRPAIRLATIE